MAKAHSDQETCHKRRLNRQGSSPHLGLRSQVLSHALDLELRGSEFSPNFTPNSNKDFCQGQTRIQILARPLILLHETLASQVIFFMSNWGSYTLSGVSEKT
jgi:hypothetical protein